MIAIVAASVMAAVGYVMPAHRVEGHVEFHSYYADGGAWSLLALGTVAVLGLVVRRSKKLGTGMIVGLLGAGGAIGAAAPVILAHFLSSVETAAGQELFALGIIGSFLVGAGLLIAEPVLYILERRAREIASRPAPLPVAIATRVQS